MCAKPDGLVFVVGSTEAFPEKSANPVTAPKMWPMAPSTDKSATKVQMYCTSLQVFAHFIFGTRTASATKNLNLSLFFHLFWRWVVTKSSSGFCTKPVVQRHFLEKMGLPCHFGGCPPFSTLLSSNEDGWHFFSCNALGLRWRTP